MSATTLKKRNSAKTAAGSGAHAAPRRAPAAKSAAAPTTAAKTATGASSPAGAHYLTPEQIADFEKMFSKMRSGILHSAERLMDTMKDEVNIISDENDRASKESEFAVELQEREREHRLLNKIQSALDRINNGTFGYCEECEMPIGYKRLKARPVATLCIECKNLQEQLEKSGSV